VPANELKKFEMNHTKEVERRLTDTIEYWIDNGEVKWEVLWKALCHSIVSQENLGRKIRDWYQAKTLRDPRLVNYRLHDILHTISFVCC
jgi:hypothetical protein